MARGTQLGTLVDMLRKEVGDATNAALGANAVDHYKQVIRRIQEQLFDEHDWPFKKIKRNIQMQAGVRYYAFPSDLDPDRVNKVEYRNGSQWGEVCFGIDEEQYNAIDSDAGEREDIVRRWDFAENDTFEVWPIPTTTGQTLPTGLENNLRMRGTKKLNPLVSETDRAELDDLLIVLTARAEILTRRKAADAKDAQNTAARRLATVKANFSKKTTFQMGGEDCDDEVKPRILVAYAR